MNKRYESVCKLIQTPELIERERSGGKERNEAKMCSAPMKMNKTWLVGNREYHRIIKEMFHY